jgi:GT2 family glycosyltransferase
MSAAARIAAVAIGRNEGARLVRCLASLSGAGRVVYVDSGSTDGSQDAARAAGAEVVALDTALPFTAARARNAGLARALAAEPRPDYVQFVDGDCELRQGWLDTAFAFLDTHPRAAVACGRRRERFPEASVYNRLIDAEWATPPGRAKSCGGDALMRAAALDQVGGYRDDLIAGEEPELCVRLREAGWEIWRLDAEMTWHDAALTRFSQWWKRARRAGHAFAEGAALHGAPPERHRVAETRRALAWGVALPLATLAGLLVTPWALLLLAAWPAQVLRLRLRTGEWTRALFLTLGRLPEAQGVLGYALDRLRGRRRGLIEYK